jgi:hypothetical protein
MKGGIDRGFCFSYALLSNRRKLLRTLWFGPVLLLMMLLVPEIVLGFGAGSPETALRWSWYGLCAFVQLLFAAQLLGNDRRWRREKADRQLV